MEIVMVGGGGHARSILEVIREPDSRSRVVGYLDSGPVAVLRELGIPHLGTDADAEVPRNSYGMLGMAALTGWRTRLERVARLDHRFSGWARVCSTSASVAPDVELGCGTVVMPGAVIRAGVTVGEHCVINSGAVIDHESTLGHNVHIAPGAVLGGNVRIDDHAFVGLGARVRNGVWIGAGAVIGMAAGVVESVARESRVIGVPARVEGRSNHRPGG